MEDLEKYKALLLENERWYVETLDGQHIYSAKDFSQNGRYYLYYHFDGTIFNKTHVETVPFSITIDEHVIQYSLGLGEEYMKAILLSAEKDKKDDDYYLPGRKMCDLMPHHSEILFYSNPRNESKSFLQYFFGQEEDDDMEVFLKKSIQLPKYRFDYNNLVGRKEFIGRPILDALTLKEISEMASFFYYKMVPELQNLNPLLGKSLLKEFGEINKKSFFKGILKAFGSEVLGEALKFIRMK